MMRYFNNKMNLLNLGILILNLLIIMINITSLTNDYLFKCSVLLVMAVVLNMLINKDYHLPTTIHLKKQGLKFSHLDHYIVLFFEVSILVYIISAL